MYRYLKIICIFFLLSAAGTASAQDTRKQEEKKVRLEREIAIIDKQLQENASQSSSILSDLTLIRKNISNRKALVQEADRKVRSYNDSIYLAQREINRMKARIDTLTSRYARLVRSAYKNRDARVWYMYMFASDNLGQAFRRFGYFRSLSNQMKSEARNIRAMRADLEAKRVRLSEMKEEAEAVKAERVSELEKLRKDEDRANNVSRRLKNDRKKYENQLKAKKKEVNELNREIARIIAEAMKTDDQKKTDKKRPPVDMKLGGEFADNKGKLPWPAEGPILGRFGKQYNPVLINFELPQTYGVDIALSKGTQVQAVFDGIVNQVITIPGYNKCVLVQHGNYFTLYGRLGSVFVNIGDKVNIGDALGVIDTINSQTQLHFEVWDGKDPQNPEHWLR